MCTSNTPPYYVSLVLVLFSQMLILPPFQKKGHGAHLLQSVYDHCYANSKVGLLLSPPPPPPPPLASVDDAQC